MPSSFSTIYFFFIFILYNCGIVFCAKDYKKTSDLAVAVFKFIYNNEQICGDMFANASWFPARHNCELRCRMDTQICQMSGEAMAIRRQRCRELPLQCRRHLKKLVGGAELYTKPKKRGNPMMEKQRNSVNISKETLREAHAKPLLNNTTKPPRQIRINTSSARRPPLTAELVPLVKDLSEILIQPAQFHTTMLPEATKAITTRKPLVKPLTTLNGEKPSKSSVAKPKHLPSPVVDDRLQRMFEQLYIESTTTTADGSAAVEKTITLLPTSSSSSGGGTAAADAQPQQNKYLTHNTTLASTTTTTTTTTTSSPSARQEWQSAELDQPFMGGNSFGLNASSEGNSTASSSRKDQAVQAAAPRLAATDRNEVFGPPLNPFITNYEQQQQQQQQQPELAETSNNANSDGYVIGANAQNSTHSPPSSSPSTSTPSRERTQNLPWSGPINNNNNMERGTDKVVEMMPKTMEEVHRRQIPWWNWREFAEALRQRPPPFYSSASTVNPPAAGGGILSLDKSVRCCHWALEGLCDRSWQRVRALCPKSCGTLVCSSIDGTLSCNRAIDVDVIDCYEQRRRQPSRSQPLATTPAWPEAIVASERTNFGAKFESNTVSPEENDNVGGDNDANDNANGNANDVAERRQQQQQQQQMRSAFAVEKEMKMFIESTTRAV
uniref:ShKT domain-containing protein n=1 Tax=Globodera rostochiensis TaxID=31243 RepID=A0A914GXU1_GLORO